MPFLASLRALGGARGRLAEALAAAPGFTAPAKLALAEVPGMGLGLVAAEPLAAGESVLRVPQALWRPFSAEHALEQARTRCVPRHEYLAVAYAGTIHFAAPVERRPSLSVSSSSPRRWLRKASKAQPSWCVLVFR